MVAALLSVVSLAALLGACACACSHEPAVTTGTEGDRASERERMVKEQIEARGVRDPLVLAAVRDVPRHLFVPPELAGDAYDDRPLPIGHDQTISQPFIVAYMTAVLGLRGGERVLEIGTGSGYQAAVLARIAGEVYSIEIVEPLAEEARERLERLGFANVRVRAGDGYAGWPEAAPFDAIVLTAAPPEIPAPLLEQLAVGGRLIAPVGRGEQDLVLARRTASGIEQTRLIGVRFVPMTGRATDGARD